MSGRPFEPDGAHSPVENVPAPLDAVVRRVATLFPGSFLVGGAVRDLLMGRIPEDYDLAVAGDPVELLREEAASHRLGFVLLDPDRRIARIVVKEPRLTLDAAPMEGGSVAVDLARRDFTVNAIALSLRDGTVTDLFGGVDDLRQRSLRPVTTAIFADDPARLLRLYRLAVTRDMRPNDDARRMAREQGALIDSVPAERLWQELARLFALPCAGAVRLMADDRILDRLFPALSMGRGMSQNRWHHLDVFEHSLATLQALDEILADPSPLGLAPPQLAARLAAEIAHGVPRSVPLRLAALLHDIGKPLCRSVQDGVVRFLRHDEVGDHLASRRLRELAAPNTVVEGVSLLVRNHLRPLNALHEGALTRRAAWRYGQVMGAMRTEGASLAWADALATGGPAVTAERREQERQALSALLREDEAAPQRKRFLDGHAVMDLTGLAEGSAVGRLLAALEEAVGVGEVTCRGEAIVFVRTLAAQEAGKDRR
ncbi:MAG: HD domain-containing protein [Nitrospinae bacterium]|nr:HD domain-containing protein [Nitrospinota bacterium]